MTRPGAGTLVTPPATGTWWQGQAATTVRQSTLALTDQAVVSATSFLTAVLVGRLAGPDELALYSLGLTLLVLVSAVQESVVLLPYTVRANRVTGGDGAEFAGTTLVFNLGLTVVAVGAFTAASAACALGFGPVRFAPMLGVLALVAPFVMLRDFGRRVSVAHLRMRTVLGLDVAVAATQLCGLLCVIGVTALSATRAYAVIGLACAIAGLSWLLRSRAGFTLRRGQIRGTWSRNWAFGRWVIASRLAKELNSTTLLLWLLVFTAGDTAAGIFAACLTIPLLSNPVILGLGLFLTPKMAETFSQGGAAAVRARVSGVTLALGALLATFVIGVGLVGGPLMQMIYGRQYGDQTHVIVVQALAISLAALSIGAVSALLAIQRPEVNLSASLLGLGTMLVLSWFLLPRWGALGAAYCLLGASATESVARLALFARLVPAVPPSRSTLAAPDGSPAREY